MKLEGKIIKILANFYYVIDNENYVWECFARGRLLKEGKLLFAGDRVEIETSGKTQGVIVNLLQRKNKISKPPVANIDQVIVVFSTCEPEFDFYNLDRYLSFIRYELSVEKIIVCINKTDLKKINIDRVYKGSNFNVFYVSALTKDGLDKFALELKDMTSVLTGPSGVGKSSLIKIFAQDESIVVGSLSSIKQGKHITRYTQLVPVKYNYIKGLLADTPGFTQFSFAALDPYKVLSTFNELNNLQCTFSSCLHNNEEGCSINKFIDSGIVPKSRYENYLKILYEVKSEIEYNTKEEEKVKTVGGESRKKDKNLKGMKNLPKIDEELRKKSRKKMKQDIQKLDQNNDF